VTGPMCSGLRLTVVGRVMVSVMLSFVTQTEGR
jgi:hypothetical protein